MEHQSSKNERMGDGDEPSLEGGPSKGGKGGRGKGRGGGDRSGDRNPAGSLAESSPSQSSFFLGVKSDS